MSSAAPEITIPALHFRKHFRKRKKRPVAGVIQQDKFIILGKSVKADSVNTGLVSPYIKSHVLPDQKLITAGFDCYFRKLGKISIGYDNNPLDKLAQLEGQMGIPDLGIESPKPKKKTNEQ